MEREVFIVRKNYKNIDHGIDSDYLKSYLEIPSDTSVKEKNISLIVELPEIKTDNIRKENINIFVEEYSRKTNNNWILFINGFSSSVNLWRYQKAEILRSGYNIILFDLLGQGKSSKPEGVKYSMDSQIKIIDEIVKNTPLKDKKFFITAISAGGPIAMTYTHRNQNKVLGLFLIATFIKKEGIISYNDEITKEILSLNIPDIKKQELITKKLMGIIFSDNFLRRFRPTIDNLIKENIERNTVGSIEGSLYTSDNFDGTNILKDIRVPTVVFSGQHDKIIDTYHSYTMANILPNSQRYVFKGVNASHTFIIEMFETFNSIFLNEIKDIEDNNFKGSNITIYVENDYVSEEPENKLLEIHL
ncbi:MAG TPA: alpha/beta hydrolase [Spirochaetota bacterium]|nr:alpha/beta hydrolase [Spirochaetota bacterium]HOM38628.1 alpha/beta hydrolase [Spirochaetota bacterium]HPQ49765.1 alpha/beta hydrolase [Spirochaetota bacterium]